MRVQATRPMFVNRPACAALQCRAFALMRCTPLGARLQPRA
jgi:hypothetical protein